MLQYFSFDPKSGSKEKGTAQIKPVQKSTPQSSLSTTTKRTQQQQPIIEPDLSAIMANYGILKFRIKKIRSNTYSGVPDLN
ncbi:hypothetical protein BpHYR1_032221 [Brachionus plicatilis]|uniref:Uncharacterized protein n=1 Tax=Brachionus plicatilis TaxID=10195 RepID=A0A3M7QQU7_BRAPC|nr:hypothetical protein BpHYR1_032221 [Brachionus plicatilis]